MCHAGSCPGAHARGVAVAEEAGYKRDRQANVTIDTTATVSASSATAGQADRNVFGSDRTCKLFARSSIGYYHGA